MIAPFSWSSPRAFVGLVDGEVHVWRFALTPSSTVLDQFEKTLSQDELTRADRFRGPGLRARFIAGRGALRTILARYTGQSPESLEFAYRENGKPWLTGQPGPQKLEFNLAHSHELALCGIVTNRVLGVDIEYMRPMQNGPAIIQRFFSPSERAEFLSLPEAGRFAAFYRGWTRKEAYLKAVGTGLATELDSFDVPLAPNAPPALLRIGDDPSEPGRWLMCDIEPGAGYAGSLVVARGGMEPPRVRLWQAEFG
jgi:4'-phosphopantetheinyl transferase